jgi:xanthine/CO dehydrogenase XdhC/CoxF family maturation factor
MPVAISVDTAQSLIVVCEDRYQQLIKGGCTEDVACDRVFDTLECVLEREGQHCFDPRDRLFENKLRTIARKGAA